MYKSGKVCNAPANVLAPSRDAWGEVGRRPGAVREGRGEPGTHDRAVASAVLITIYELWETFRGEK